MNILLLEDDIGLADIISEYLQDNDFDVDLVYDGEEALSLSYEKHYDLYILDVNVPILKGFELLQMMRKNGDKTPAIYITSLNDIEDVKKGFESGADDYMKKPFELTELLLRIRNIQKRSFAQQRSSRIQIDKELFFDIENELLIRGEEKISLPPKELKALKYFLRHPNKIVTFEDLYRTMWEYHESGSSDALRAHIKNLRKYLSTDMIQNIRGTGYRFIPKVS
ncbi:response regulator transcription factor [Sulfurovum sp. ST-21]|uniref:Response regulator transcription factor n=1 Tax=Sulfurovum indicum TaxID=2779528 RepID=A0A7M1S943_9BACT|nr:response regulator transcription factor [Sulfurovum indicum]QOR62850.1 response regulator transcription factor [Sulfurovum indicum]